MIQTLVLSEDWMMNYLWFGFSTFSLASLGLRCVKSPENIVSHVFIPSRIGPKWNYPFLAEIGKLENLLFFMCCTVRRRVRSISAFSWQAPKTQSLKFANFWKNFILMRRPVRLTSVFF